MPRVKRNDKPILLNLPEGMFERVVIAAFEQGITRTQFLRQSIERNLRHYEKHERHLYQQIMMRGHS